MKVTQNIIVEAADVDWIFGDARLKFTADVAGMKCAVFCGSFCSVKRATMPMGPVQVIGQWIPGTQNADGRPRFLVCSNFSLS